MTWLEWIMIAWLAVAVLIGLRAGFIFMAGNLIGFVASLWVAHRYGETVAGWLGNTPWSYIIAVIGIVLVVTKLGGVAAMIVNKIAKLSFIIPFVKSINRLGGAVLSVLTHGMIVSLLAFLTTQIIVEPLITQPWSRFLVMIGGFVAGVLPTALQRVL